MPADKISPQTANVVVLELMVKQTENLFDARFDNDPGITLENLLLLREARDAQVLRLRENLRFARKVE